MNAYARIDAAEPVASGWQVTEAAFGALQPVVVDPLSLSRRGGKFEMVDVLVHRPQEVANHNIAPRRFSNIVHRTFWTMICLGILSLSLSLVALIMNSHGVAVIGVALLALMSVAALIWVERATYEWNRISDSRNSL